MQQEEIKALIEKYRAGECTGEESAFLESWYAQWNKGSLLNLSAEELEADLIAIKDNTYTLQEFPRVRRLWPSRLFIGTAAASILIALGFGAYFYFVNHTGNTRGTGVRQLADAPTDIDPGSNKAILTLADGRKIVLDEAANGELAEESGIKITKTADGQLVYEVLRHAPQARASESRITDARQPEAGSAGWRASAMRDPATYNTIQTPKGGQYKIILPDSSVVWLNAASSLKYPTRFSGAERRVELTGEAFFSVRHKTSETRHETASTHADGDANKSKIVNLHSSSNGARVSRVPFIVATAAQEVTVLGTQFNVNAYADENSVKTTLVEGSVAVRVASTSVQSTDKPINQSTNKPINQSTTLRPGEQSILSGNSLNVVAVETDEAIAWKNGYFLFNNIGLHAIMRQLQRWYDVEVDLASMPDDVFYAEIGRNVKLSEVLSMLEKSGKLQFKIVELSTNGQKERRIMLDK